MFSSSKIAKKYSEQITFDAMFSIFIILTIDFNIIKMIESDSIDYSDYVIPEIMKSNNE